VGTHTESSLTCSSAAFVNWWVEFEGLKSPTMGDLRAVSAHFVLIRARAYHRGTMKREG
jgi:hypothetical protein